MSKQDNLKDFLKDVADTIREKKGTEDLINPQDFSNEIANMSGSGADGGDILYFGDGTTPECYYDTASGVSVRGSSVITDTSGDGNALLKNDNGEFDAFAYAYVALVVGVIKNPCKSGEFKVKWLTADGNQYGEEDIQELPMGTLGYAVQSFLSGGLDKGVVKAIVTYLGNEYIFNFRQKDTAPL